MRGTRGRVVTLDDRAEIAFFAKQKEARRRLQTKGRSALMEPDRPARGCRSVVQPKEIMQ
jgi:hypothetical protein